MITPSSPRKRHCTTPIERDALHVIVPISNPVRYQSRWRLAKEFLTRLERERVNVTVVELQFGDREFVFPGALQHRTFSEIWHKENLINLGIAHVRKLGAEYVAWIDADITFARHDWLDETLEQLQHHRFVQMFSHAIDLNREGHPIQTHFGFVYSYLNGRRAMPGYESWHPGYCWAARMETLIDMGYLIDRAVLGSADRHMAGAVIGKGDSTYNSRVNQNYANMVLDWQRRADTYIQRDIGYVSGTIVHHWHGPKHKRGYNRRWSILIDNDYDPFLDVRAEDNGLLTLSSKKWELRDDLRAYFRSRDEDATG